MLEGFHAVKHAVRFDAMILAIVTCSMDGFVRLIKAHAPDIETKVVNRVEVVSREDMLAAVGSLHPTETAALAVLPTWSDVDPLGVGRAAPAVLLENPRNLGNIGAVVRVAAGMGASSVFTSGEVDPWHSHVVRASAGLHWALPVVRLHQPVDSIQDVVIAFDAGGVDLQKLVIPSDAMLAFGSERHGISSDLRARADVIAAIPMRRGVSSYNLATSVAMALYQWAHRRA